MKLNNEENWIPYDDVAHGEVWWNSETKKYLLVPKGFERAARYGETVGVRELTPEDFAEYQSKKEAMQRYFAKAATEESDLTADAEVRLATRALVREACEKSGWHRATAIDAVEQKLCITRRAAESFVSDEFEREGGSE